MFNIVSPGFNDSLDDYLNKRRDKQKLSKSFYSAIKSRKSKASPFSEDEVSPKSQSGSSFFSFFRKRIPSDDEVFRKEHDKQVAQERAEMKDDDEMMQQKTQVVDDDYEDFQDEQVLEKKEKKQGGGIFSKIFNMSSKKDDKEREDLAIQMQLQQQNIEDLKETIKVLHRWLEKLPADKIGEFKRSPDFEKYKQGLRNLGLIKE